MATAVDYNPNMSVLSARARYFQDNAFGDDGGYGDKWVTIWTVGPLKIGFPNTAARVRAVRLHDLHHLVTGYDTDIIGEAEIAAWELASGCERFPAATVLNRFALALGVVREPARVRRAFARGCNSKNLYDKEWDEALLDERLGDLRERLEVAPIECEALTEAQRGRYHRQLTAALLSAVALLSVLAAMLVAVAWALVWLIA